MVLFVVGKQVNPPRCPCMNHTTYVGLLSIFFPGLSSQNHLIEIPFSLFFSASSVVSSYGPTSATREHEKRILETILPPDLRHLVHGNSSSALHVNTILAHLSGNHFNPKKLGIYIFYSFFLNNHLKFG